MVDKKCKLEDCFRVEQTRRGYCKKHYSRFMQHGDPYKITRVTKDMTISERFEFIGWTEVVRTLPTPCWEWNGDTTSDRNGYGVIVIGGVKHRVHRVSYELFVGPFDPELQMLHKCDNPPCMNPKHLYPGTTKDNMRDAIERGRLNPPQGSLNGMSILKEGQVRTIFDLKGKQHVRDVANTFEVSIQTVYSIWNGSRWGHITSS